MMKNKYILIKAAIGITTISIFYLLTQGSIGKTEEPSYFLMFMFLNSLWFEENKTVMAAATAMIAAHFIFVALSD
ncbi:hypothetical protein MZE98_02045 [Neisseria gonorrhoeae]|uniref:Uncharacterized protein n=1 Tax=Neisseria gonorrhoeae TaxID=485 RepID=A0AB74EDS0_NEIGO|nr:hypothetical protein [Neisseria gonorrhoeae]KLS76789.1 membrane protein [Neisseria gonorrhoeae MU_NG1]KLS90727.1 membrane protein [Neisseria gonorrhoeae MU_NG6]MCK2171973.1 hypothetical protein [Neisseria gonorrhoeae]SBN14341.1 Uncharacterised protein [Neisseria gonorrhoeae]SBQ19001.1 Uncharacterised protein [Neisseria gonorrhoeae]